MIDDLIRRSDVLAQIENIAPIGCKSVGSDAYMITRMVEELAAVEPPIPVTQERLFTKEFSDGHKEYRYGPEWVAMQLFMEGGYKTPEEAKQRWLTPTENSDKL